MSYASYPVYKHSGVEWLGEVPEHWEITPLRHLATIRNGSDYKHVQVDDGGYAVIGSGGEFARASAFLCDTPSVLLGRKGTIDKPLFVDEPFWTVDTMYYTEMRPACSPKFLYHFCTRIPFSYFQYGSALPSMTQTDLYSLPVPLPPLAEQQAIAAFLDTECARIDTLIERQNRLIELLQEKRQAVITQAVTRGLNADVPLKHSGVEWLGQVPEHWRVGNIKRFARLESGHTPSRQHPEYWIDCKHKWFTLSDVWQLRDGKTETVTDTAELISDLGLEHSAARLLPRGTVMLSRTASVGFSAIMGVSMATSQDFANWVCRQELSPEFLLYSLRAMTNELKRLMYGSTHNTIYMPDITRLSIAVPPLVEQLSVVTHIRNHLHVIDNTIAKAQRSIELMQERRSALISAAVTGKIDVRKHSEQRTH